MVLPSNSHSSAKCINFLRLFILIIRSFYNITPIITINAERSKNYNLKLIKMSTQTTQSTNTTNSNPEVVVVH